SAHGQADLRPRQRLPFRAVHPAMRGEGRLESGPYEFVSSFCTSVLTSFAISTKARAAGERCRSACHTTQITLGEIGGSRFRTRTRSSPGEIASRGQSATP